VAQLLNDLAELYRLQAHAMLTYMTDKGSPLNAYPAFWALFSIIGEGAAEMKGRASFREAIDATRCPGCL
jgi:hypothetical protein